MMEALGKFFRRLFGSLRKWFGGKDELDEQSKHEIVQGPEQKKDKPQ